MKRAYIKPEMATFKTEVHSMICQSLTYEESPVVQPTDPVLVKDMGFDPDDFNFDFIE